MSDKNRKRLQYERLLNAEEVRLPGNIYLLDLGKAEIHGGFTFYFRIRHKGRIFVRKELEVFIDTPRNDADNKACQKFLEIMAQRRAMHHMVGLINSFRTVLGLCAVDVGH